MSWYPLPLLWSGGCQNETTKWEMTLSRFVRPRCGSFPSYFSWFLRNSAVAEAEGAISGQENIAWRSPAAKEKNHSTSRCFPSFKKKHSVYQISSKGWGKMKEILWNSFRCLATPVSARHEGHRPPFGCLSSLGSALQNWGLRELQQLYILMLLLRRDATRCYPNSKEAIHLQKQQTLAIHWAVLKSLPKSSQN